MKKIIFAVAILGYCMLTTMITKAQRSLSVPDAVMKSFSDHFKNSQSARWTKIQEAYVTTFYDGKDWKDAYFTENGELKGIGRFTTTDFLPLFVRQKINDHSNYELIEAYQYECMENGLCFFAVLRNKKNQLILKMNPYGEVTYSQKRKLPNDNNRRGRSIALNPVYNPTYE
jgi:hypothetical protein